MRKKSNKAQGLPLNTIIIAILVIIVLVVIVLIFTGKMGFFGKSLDTCEGDCFKLARDCNRETTVPIPMDCDKNSEGIEYCCKPLS